MWPFSRDKKPEPVPTVRCGDVEITWNLEFLWWEFSTGEIDYSLIDNPVFDSSLLSRLTDVAEWLAGLESEIDHEIQKHVDDLCDWQGQKDLIGVDVSWLVTKNEVDVSYGHQDWSDLGVNVVITDGKITNSYSGD